MLSLTHILLFIPLRFVYLLVLVTRLLYCCGLACHERCFTVVDCHVTSIYLRERQVNLSMEIWFQWSAVSFASFLLAISRRCTTDYTRVIGIYRLALLGIQISSGHKLGENKIRDGPTKRSYLTTMVT
ncbi:hypothetical protein QBC37DRAFT_135495 [Rhypophila decipiens]|uniref:Uncharacterized protein n=1 Tax=Rhypophila decipiens TaxID=261697 RepID=A0AAN7BFH6_9PEZI|nr:hypothetical protein QBC37DRAFT_135495 [Rhypophila decipiens]